jgi:alkylation response protein AidB-like acyl-CoA dehydrogenase
MLAGMHTDTEVDWVERARTLGPALASAARAHDRDGSFVHEAYALLQEHRFFSLAVPRELGGGGASFETLCETIREVARHCASTALALSMHSHLVAATVWKHLRGQPGEQLLRKVASEQAVLLSTGASDWVDSNGSMRKVDGGYRVSARKIFGSGGPVASIIIASARWEDAPEGPQVLHFPVPTSADGVRLLDDWDTLGMRGTGSSTVVLEDVFVPEEAIALRRPAGQWHPAWSVVMTVAPPIYMAPYVGIAEAAAAEALRLATRKGDAPHLPYLAGELTGSLHVARVLWRDMVKNAAEYAFAPEVARADRALVGKTEVARHAIATVHKAMELAGGQGFFRRHDLERMLRDVEAAPYHPLPEKRQHLFSGRLALGLDPITGAPLG